MTEQEKVDVLKYNILRFDHYYASVNFKSSFLVLGNITILGFLLRSKEYISCYFFYTLILFIASSLISVLLAIKPYLKKYNKESIIFFQDIANMKNEYFQDKIKNLSIAKYLNDLEEQVYILAKGLNRKFLYLNIATITFIFTIAIFFFYLGFTNGLGEK